MQEHCSPLFPSYLCLLAPEKRFPLSLVRPQPPYCSMAEHTCGTWVAIPFFTTFFAAISLVLLQLFMAVIIDAYEEQKRMVRCGRVNEDEM